MDPLCDNMDEDNVIAYRLLLARRCLCERNPFRDWHILSDHVYSESSWSIVLQSSSEITEDVNKRNHVRCNLSGKLASDDVCTDPLCLKQWKMTNKSEASSDVEMSDDAELNLRSKDAELNLRSAIDGCEEALWVMDQVSRPEQIQDLLDQPNQWDGCYDNAEKRNFRRNNPLAVGKSNRMRRRHGKKSSRCPVSWCRAECKSLKMHIAMHATYTENSTRRELIPEVVLDHPGDADEYGQSSGLGTSGLIGCSQKRNDAMIPTTVPEIGPEYLGTLIPTTISEIGHHSLDDEGEIGQSNESFGQSNETGPNLIGSSQKRNHRGSSQKRNQRGSSQKRNHRGSSQKRNRGRSKKRNDGMIPITVSELTDVAEESQKKTVVRSRKSAISKPCVTKVYRLIITCTECEENMEYAFSFSKIMPMHKRIQDNGIHIHCSVCESITQATAKIDNECKNMEDALPKPILACDICTTLEFNELLDWESHDTEHSKDPHKCLTCGVVRANRICLKRHISRMHTPDKLCDICGVFYRYDNHHQIAGHTARLECSECGKQFTRRLYLTRHIRRYHQPHLQTEYLCNFCGKKFVAYSTFYEHQMQHKFGKHECNMCGKEYSNGRSLRRHQRTRHVDERIKYKCDICDKQFISDRGIEIHKKNQHGNPEDRPVYRCDQCGKKFMSKNGFEIHCKNHCKYFQ